jgi:hypothetical protein
MGSLSNSPPSLTHAKAAADLVQVVYDLIEDKEKKKIEKDIKALHSLNEKEKEKYDEAIALIEEHKNVLAETKKLADKAESEKIKAESALADAQKKLEEADLQFARVKVREDAALKKEAELEEKSKLIDAELAKHKKLSTSLEKKEQKAAELEAELEKTKAEYEAKIEKLKQVVL